jgi:hypothetical protein
MSYKGYRVKLGNTTIPELLIAKGSYSYENEKRLIRTWQDANGKYHDDYFKNPKAKITFSIRARNQEDHESIKDIFMNQNNLTVEYFDDYSCTYKTGTFKMKAPKIQHRFASGVLFYEPTNIELEEY